MSEPMEPVFMDPPPVLRDAAWAKTVAALIARTGEWALVYEGKEAEVITGRIRAKRGAWAGHVWEATTRKTESFTRRQVYARHVSRDGDE